ncbi:cytochrome P450 [Penicillium malachiteum]|uniref:cytochrome P450 n=1 Tax=Penicillium malachiteum TaxID=1324776 RepID=UPI002546E151|nr:cytochrome P450 [Penicillium malachiteum]KAJ5737530.1 cytochrome P450 [Penicillium malachiteum]
MGILECWIEHIRSGFSPKAISALVLVAILAAWSGKILFLRFFHPVARFPGPLAASRSPQWLYDVLCTGHSEEIFEELHKEYNTKALRIAPNELHISDVDLYKTIYMKPATFLKDQVFFDGFQTPHSFGAECDWEIHKAHRRMANTFWSRRTLLNIEPLLHEKTNTLIKKMREMTEKNPSINIVKAIRCLFLDTTMVYLLSLPWNTLEEKPDSFNAHTIECADGMDGNIWARMYTPTSKHIKELIFGKPADESFEEFDRVVKEALDKFQETGNVSSHPVLFENLTSTSVHQQHMDLIDGIFGGYHPFTTSVTACVKEVFRLSTPIAGRLPRVVPDTPSDPLIVDGKIVPPGTIVSVTAYSVNLNEEIWGPDAKAFNPDRWLKDAEQILDLDQYLVTFGKGPRMCPAQGMVYAHLTIALAYLVKSFKISFPLEFKAPDLQSFFMTMYPQEGMSLHFEAIKP